MPKQGKPDSYWEGVMKQYAQGDYKFRTGRTPGSKRWKDALRSIDGCPRHKGQVVDLLGRSIKCKCGYHEDGSELATSQSATSRSTIMPSSASHTSIRPSAANHTTVRPLAASHTTVRPPAVSHTTVRLPAASHTTVRPSAASNTTVRLPAASHTTVQPPAASQMTIRPLAASHTTVRPLAASHTTVQPTAASHTTVKPSAASQTTVRPLAARHTTVRPTAASHTTVRPLAASHTTVQPTAASHTTVKPSAASQTTIMPLASSHTTVRPTAAIRTTVQPPAASHTTARSSSASHITVRSPAASHDTVRPPEASYTTVQPTAASHTIVKPADSHTIVGPPAPTQTTSTPSLKCGLCKSTVLMMEFNQHLLDMHAVVHCDHCGDRMEGELALATHIENHHTVTLSSQTQVPLSTVWQEVPTLNRSCADQQEMPTLDTSSNTQQMSPTLDISIEQKIPTLDTSSTAQQLSPTLDICIQQEMPTLDTAFTQQQMSPTLDTSIQQEIPTPDTLPTQQQTSAALDISSTIRQEMQALDTSTLQQEMPAIDTSFTVQQETHTWTVPQAHLEWQSFLPSQFKKLISLGDQAWIAQCLYDHRGRLKDTLSNQNWYYPPSPCPPVSSPPDPQHYFRQRMFLWAPMRMWQIPLHCPRCGSQLQHSGIYPKAREVVDVDSRYYLIGVDYPRCGRCKVPFCPWNPEILSQLDPSHRNLFPAVLTKYEALDKKCVTLMKPRTQGNSSSYIQQALHEVHSEEWGKRCIQYLADCELHRKGAILTGNRSIYKPPPPFRPLPLAQWFEMAHTNEILSHVEEMKGVITSTYGRVLKVDSTKKVTKKLAGDVGETASWMTNIANEHSQVLNSVLTTGEGPALYGVCQGIVKRYRDAGEPEPEVIYVDRDCCSQTGEPAVLEWFHPWKCHVRLDIFHFMRRFTKGLTTEHHPLYGTFCSKFSSCVFVWDKEDYAQLRDAKRAEVMKKYRGVIPTEKQITAAITPSELARHCRRRTREVNEMKGMIDQLLKEMWELTDTTGLRLINADSMEHVWSVQQKHLPCIVDPPGVHLYTKTGTLEKGGKMLDVLKCARGSSSLEAFHRHQCTFIPGWRANAVHTQMYMVEGGSRWNINRAREVSDLATTSQTRLYDIRLMSSINALSQRVLKVDLLPEFRPPGKPTGEHVAVDYLLAQSGKGDLRSSFQGVISDPDDGEVLPELNLEEATEEEFLDDTVCLAEHIDTKFQARESGLSEATQPPAYMSQCERCGIMLDTGDMAVHVVTHMDEPETGAPESQEVTDIHSEDASHKPVHVIESRHDARGFPGWEAVDALAEYLVNLDTSVTALSTADTDMIVQLYDKLHECDKATTKYTLKSKKERLPGPWRASRKRSGATPGVQASERLYMTHGQAAQSPTSNRVSECVCLRLMRSYQQARNRPKDSVGKTLPLAQSIVHTYGLIQQLLADSRVIQEVTNLVLVTINNTTVSAWLNKRQKRMDREALLQGTMLPESISTSIQPLPKARLRPSEQQEHGHEPMAFQEPENRQGQSVKRPRKNRLSTETETTTSETTPEAITFNTGPVAQAASSNPVSTVQPPMWQPGAWPTPPPFPQGFPGWYGWPPYYMPPYGPPSGPPPSSAGHPPSTATPLPTSPPAQSSRHRDWRHRRAAQEDQERIARGELPKKRYKKPGQYRYICTTCQRQKCAETGHTQVKGRWYCPSIGITVEEWKQQLNN